MSERAEGYFEKATSWALDQQSMARSMLRTWRIVAAVAVLIALLEAVALVALTPPKTVTPIPILVDRQTGYVERLDAQGQVAIQSNPALTQALLAQYVIGREGFDIATAAADYRKVALWSAGDAKRDYLTLMPASNPQSPLNRFGRSAIVDTTIRSVSPLGPQTALVRYDTRTRYQDGRASRIANWAAVVNYRFSNESMSFADRLTNPLGFQVVRYRSDPEAIAPQEPDQADLPASKAPTLATDVAPSERK